MDCRCPPPYGVLLYTPPYGLEKALTVRPICRRARTRTVGTDGRTLKENATDRRKNSQARLTSGGLLRERHMARAESGGAARQRLIRMRHARLHARSVADGAEVLSASPTEDAARRPIPSAHFARLQTPLLARSPASLWKHSRRCSACVERRSASSLPGRARPVRTVCPTARADGPLSRRRSPRCRLRLRRRSSAFR